MAQTSEQTSAKEAAGPNAAATANNAGAISSNPNSNLASVANATTASQPPSASATTAHHQPLEHDDKDFDPTAEALIDEIDDERTLEEEEALAADPTAVQNELDDLKRESEMPIEELLAYYERMRNEGAAGEEAMGEEEEDDEEFDEDEDDDEEEDDEQKQQQSRAPMTTQSNQLQTSPLHQKQAQQQSTQPSQQVNPTLANSQLLSPLPPPPPSHTSPQSPNRLQSPHMPNDPKVTETNSTNNNTPPAQEVTKTITCNQRASQDSAQAVQQPSAHDQLDLTNSKSSSSSSTCQEQTINAGLEDGQPLASNHHDNTHTSPATKTRPKHSMTEFLVDTGTTSDGMFKSLLDYDLDDSDDLDEDYSYTDDEYEDEREWRRVIHVGPEHQAVVPDGLNEYENDLPPYENDDKLVWRCNSEQTQEQIVEYLKTANLIPRRNDISISSASVPKISDDRERLYRERMHDQVSNAEPLPVTVSVSLTTDNPPENMNDVYMSQSRKRFRIHNELEQENAMDGINQQGEELSTIHLVNHVRDDNSDSISQDNRPELSTEDYFHGEEELLYLLLQCNHNCEEALRRRRLDPFKYYISEPMSLWSQDECLSFEHGLRIYGKNFYLIKENKVPTRTRAEVVAFYYSWKKSERHDVYTDRYKLDRKRSLTHPGTTDYMDKFIEDTESALNAPSSTPTPTPTESTAEMNQLADANQSSEQALSTCHTPEIKSMMNCPSHKDATSRPNDVMYDVNQSKGDANDGSDSSLCVDGNSAI